MGRWKARLLALLTAVAMLVAISGPAAMADDWDDWYGYYCQDDDWYDDRPQSAAEVLSGGLELLRPGPSL